MPERLTGGWGAGFAAVVVRFALCLFFCVFFAAALGCGATVQPKGQVVTGVSVGGR